MTKEQFAHCKACWDVFEKICVDSGDTGTPKKAKMMVGEIGAIATFAFCGFADKDLPEDVKQIIADGLMYLEISLKENAANN